MELRLTSLIITVCGIVLLRQSNTVELGTDECPYKHKTLECGNKGISEISRFPDSVSDMKTL